MPRSFERAWLPVVLGLAVTAACSSVGDRERGDGVDPFGPSLQASSSGADVGAAAPTVRVQPAVDLQSVVHRAAFAFRADRGMLTAGGPTFEANVAGSAIRITPRRADVLESGTPLSLETTRVVRGTRVLASDDRAASSVLESDGAVTLRRGDVTERIENDGAGIEQSWRFEQLPSGGGDLVVRVRAAGERYSASSDHGLHFGSSSGPGLRYGTATWVDASGKRTVVVPRFVASTGEIVMTVPDAVVASSQYPAVLDPTLTPETEIDKPIAGSSAGGDQNAPSITSQGPGKGYFAVWFDRRGVRPAIYGARIATDGKVIDDTGIPIATSVGSNQPYIAASDGGYLVVWTVSYIDVYQQPGVYAVRLDANGAALDQAPVVIAANVTNVQGPSAAFDGTNWLTAWHRYVGGTTSYDIFGARIGKTGAPLDATPIEISKDVDAEFYPVVRFDGTNYFVTWRSYISVFGRKFGKDGVALGARVALATSPSGSLYNFDATFDGTRHVVAWSTYNGVNGQDIYARRFDLSGAPQDAADIPIAVDANYDDRPRVASDGTNFLVAFSRSGLLYGARMSPAGAVLNPPTSLATGTDSYYDYAMASDGLGSLIVNSEYLSPIGYDIKEVKIAKGAPVATAPVVLSKAANSETQPSLAWNGTTHYAVWIDSRDGQPGIWGARLGPDAQPQPPIKIASDVKYTQLSRPRVASDGTGFLVVFYAYDSTLSRPIVYGQSIDATGTPSGAPFELTTVNPNIYQYGNPDAAFDGTNFLVVWEQRSNDGQSIGGVRLPKASTTPIDKEPLRISTLSIDEQRTTPALAFDGASYFVSWITSRNTASNIQVSHVYGTRVSKEGSSLDGETALCDAFLLQRAPRVAADTKHGGFFVAWEDYRTALEAADIYGARVSPMGQNLDTTSGMPIATGTQDESGPDVTYARDETNWVVAYRDLRSKQTYDIYGAWISLAGTNHDPKGFLLSAEAGDEESPALSTSAPGRLVLAYERLDPRTGYGSYRLRARAVDSGAPVAAACATNDDCATRNCVDKVCCSTACGACGVCNATPGTCTPRAAGTESPTCPTYKCQGTTDCPSKCNTDADCASNASCDPATKTCVSRVICSDSQTLKDLTGKLTSCTPYGCIADACRTQCGSVDDCATGFVCDNGGRCIEAPTGDATGCSVAAPSGNAGGVMLAGAVWMAAALLGRRRRRAA